MSHFITTYPTNLTITTTYKIVPNQQTNTFLFYKLEQINYFFATSAKTQVHHVQNRLQTKHPDLNKTSIFLNTFQP